MHCWAVVVAAGSGSRFGRLKQLETLAGRRVIDWSVDAVSRVCEGVVVVGPDTLGSAVELGVDARVEGGATRSDSVRRGLAAVSRLAGAGGASGPLRVLIHDAARPLVPEAVVDAVVAALDGGAEAVVPVVPVTDSLRSVDGRSVDRSGFVAAQTPQGFDLAALQAAHHDDPIASDDATLMEAAGHTVHHVDGDPVNIKITFPHDLGVAEQLMRSGVDRAGVDRAGVDR